MITLDSTNCFENKVSNGLSSKEFKKTAQKYSKIKNILTRKKELGFLGLPFQQTKELGEITQEATAIRKKFKNVLLIGIGGSALGAIALFKSLCPFYEGTPQIFCIDNPESDYLNFLINHIDLNETLLMPISKSGNTIESLAIFAILYDKMVKKIGKKAKKQVIVLTEENDGTFTNLAKKEGFKVYPVPKNVGGRFSVFSNVGLLPAAIAGLNIQKLLQGARKAKMETAYDLAVLQYIFYQQKKKTMTVFFPYGKKFEGIADWYIQLLAESIGKNEKVGPTPLKAIGAIDQHAQLQLFMEGPNNKFYIFLETTNGEKLTIPQILKKYKDVGYLAGHDLHKLLLTERKATSEALTTKKRPNATLTLSGINEETIGELLFLLELQVAFLGELFGVNTFNQPGVELGKTLTKKYLQTK